MKKILLAAFLAIAMMAVNGCGSNDFDVAGNDTTQDGDGTDSDGNRGDDINTSEGLKLEIPIKKIVITDANTVRKIIARVTEGGFGAKGKEVVLNSDVSGDSGHFAANSAVTDGSGDATFTYMSPNTINDKKVTVKFCLKTDKKICDTMEIDLSKQGSGDNNETVDNINYDIKFGMINGANNMPLGSRSSAKVTLIDKDTGKAIPASRVQGVTVTTRDATVLKIAPEGGGRPVETITYAANHNPVKVLLTADKVNSGLAVLEVVVKYVNKNGVEKTKAQLFSVAVLSGAPTAFSINDDGVNYNFGDKQFEHSFIVQGVDNSSNPIAQAGVITVSVMASFATDSGGAPILYGRFSKIDRGISATLVPENNKAKVEMTGITPFSSYDETTEHGIKKHRAMVAVYGDVETYEANGKWNLQDIVSADTLSLGNEYHGDAHSGLGLAVGYNYRDKICTSAYEEAVVYVNSVDGKYTLDKDGKAIVVVKHDAYMIGKRIMLMVNMTGLNPNNNQVLRSGEVHEATLKFFKFLKGKTITIPKGAKEFRTGIWGIIDTGTTDEWSVVSSNFRCEIDLKDAVIVGGPFENNTTKCESGGRAYLSYDVNSTDDTKDGSITFKKCQVIDQPDF